MSNLTYDHSAEIEKILIHSCLKKKKKFSFLLTLEFHYVLLHLFCIISIIISSREGLKSLHGLLCGFFWGGGRRLGFLPCPYTSVKIKFRMLFQKF